MPAMMRESLVTPSEFDVPVSWSRIIKPGGKVVCPIAVKSEANELPALTPIMVIDPRPLVMQAS
jgi:hypothetical protein